MTRRTHVLIVAVVLCSGLVAMASPQAVMQPTPAPTVTADDAPWYLDGRPISYAGNLYYPAGPQIFFKPSEMVRSGFYEGIPLYTRTTIEPYSIVYVPLAGGRMQPYERPRTGELTGTAGSTPTLLPTPPSTVPPAGLAPQAAIAPTSTTTSIDVQWPRPMVATPVASAGPPEVPTQAVGTTGTTVPRRPMHVSIGGKPQGANAIFIEFEGRRWYPMGPAQTIDLSGLVRIGRYYDFDVFAVSGDSGEIYVPAAHGGQAVVRYSLTRR